MIILPCIYWFFFIFLSINLQSYSYIVNFSLQIPMKFKNIICLVSPNKQNNKSRLRNNVRKAWRSKGILSSHFKPNMYRGQYRSLVASKTVLGKGLPKICSKFTHKSHFDMGVLLYICCIFSGHLFLRTPLEGCSCYFSHIRIPLWSFYFIYNGSSCSSKYIQTQETRLKHGIRKLEEES